MRLHQHYIQQSSVTCVRHVAGSQQLVLRCILLILFLLSSAAFIYEFQSLVYYYLSQPVATVISVVCLCFENYALILTIFDISSRITNRIVFKEQALGSVVNTTIAFLRGACSQVQSNVVAVQNDFFGIDSKPLYKIDSIPYRIALKMT